MEIQIRRGDDLALETTLALASQVIGSSSFDSQTQRWYILSRSQDYPINSQIPTQHQLLVVDGQTLALTSLDLTPFEGDPDWPQLLLDETSGQVHLFRAAGWLVVDGQSLAILDRYQRADNYCQGHYSAFDPPGKLFAFSEDTLLHRYDPRTGRPDRPLPLGRVLVAAMTHPQDGRLYFIDSLGMLTVLDGASLQPLKRRPDLIEAVCSDSLANSIYAERIYLALDPEYNRLFVGDQRAGRTLVLDLETLNTLDQLPQVGPMALDAAGGRLFLAESDPEESETALIHTFDAATLAKLQPAGNPTEVGSYAPNFPWATQTIHQVAVAGSYAYLAAGEWGLRILDLSHPPRPAEVGFYEFGAEVEEWLPGSVKDVAVVKTADRTYVYTLVLIHEDNPNSASFVASLQVIDLSDQFNPITAGAYQAFRGLYGAEMVTEGVYSYVTSPTGLFIFRLPGRP